MVALGIITLFLTAFVLVLYAYLANNTENDVSFFMSVGIVSMIMNLCTNAGGVFGLSVLYLVIDLLFAGLAFAVNANGTLAFYGSIVPWCKRTFTDKGTIGWQVLSACVFPAGIALFFVKYRENNELAKACGKASALGLVLLALLLWMILGLVL